MTDQNTAQGYLLFPEPVDMRTGCHTLMATVRQRMKTVPTDWMQPVVFLSKNLRTVRILLQGSAGYETATHQCVGADALRNILTGLTDSHD